ncbi:MAG: LptF/LptG family permease [Bacteriovoracaceae bacterium]|nr:LptF/LptG family permease [Bacteriovoracaceae bacterium]
MNLLKRFIFKEWFKVFGASSLLLFLLLTVANLISGFLRGNVSASDILMNHLLEMPGSLNRIFPISCLVASLFSINKLKNRNELTAIFASGFSRQSFILIIVQASMVIGIFQFFVTGFLDPYAKLNKNNLIKDSEAKFRNLKSRGLKASTIGSGRLWYKSDNYYFSFAKYDKLNNTLHDVNLYYITPSYRLQKKVSVDILYYKKDKWIADKGVEVDKLDLGQFPKFSEIEQSPVLISETPKDFLQIEADITTLNIIGLYSYIAKLKKSGININEYLVLFYQKFSTSIICIIFSLVSSIAIFNPNRRGSSFGRSVVFVFIFTLMYWLIQSYFIEMGKSSKIPALVSTFSVPVVFSMFLSFFFYKNRSLQ